MQHARFEPPVRGLVESVATSGQAYHALDGGPNLLVAFTATRPGMCFRGTSFSINVILGIFILGVSAQRLCFKRSSNGVFGVPVLKERDELHHVIIAIPHQRAQLMFAQKYICFCSCLPLSHQFIGMYTDA